MSDLPGGRLSVIYTAAGMPVIDVLQRRKSANDPVKFLSI